MARAAWLENQFSSKEPVFHRSARKAVSILVGIALCAVAFAAQAEPVSIRREENPYARRHFYMGVEGVGVAVLNETGPRAFLNAGGGFNLFIGGRVHRSVALELGWQPTFHNNEVDFSGHRIDTIGLEAITMDLKFFPLQGPIQPYFTVGGGGYLLGDSFSVFAGGPGYQIGGGIDFWVTPWASVGLKAQYRGVAMLDYDVNRDNTYLSLFTGSFNFTGRF